MNILHKICGAALAAAAFSPALAGTDIDVGVGITIREPGVYGRIEIGSRPPPPVLYPQPVIIAAPPRVRVQRPIYLQVPPGHAKHWRKHCGRYDACGTPVYFVRDAGYHKHHAVRHDHRRGHRHGHHHGHDHD